MNVIFLSGLFPKEIRNEIENNSIGVIQYAADALQWALVNGLDIQTKSLKIVNLLYIGSYPLRYKDYKIKPSIFSHTYGATDINVGFLNLPLYKLFSRYLNAKKCMEEVLQNNSEVIVIYSIHTPFIKAAVDLKKRNPSIKICLVVPDLPEFMGGKDYFFFRILKKYEQKFLNKLLKKIDAFVLLSEYMHKRLNVQERPWVRVEGIFNSSDDVEVVKKEDFKTILYSGTLAKRYGIMKLLEAFSMIKDENYRLWICGDGDAKYELDEMVRKDIRISNFGQISREEVLKLQKRATVLVNPRTSEGEFTKYSFPSKTMEYLASGTPSVMYKLAGIPEEYFEYCFISEEETSKGLYQTLISVCNLKQTELDKFGEKAKRFILENKTEEKQGKIIYNMLNKL